MLNWQSLIRALQPSSSIRSSASPLCPEMSFSNSRFLVYLISRLPKYFFRPVQTLPLDILSLLVCCIVIFSCERRENCIDSSVSFCSPSRVTLLPLRSTTLFLYSFPSFTSFDHHLFPSGPPSSSRNFSPFRLRLCFYCYSHFPQWVLCITVTYSLIHLSLFECVPLLRPCPKQFLSFSGVVSFIAF